MKYLFFLCFFICTNVFASVWPTFTVPDENYLLTHNILTTSGCSSGFVRLNLSSFPVGDACKNYCPSAWTWQVISNNSCFRFNNFKLLNVDIHHVNDDSGTTTYSVITASFGNSTHQLTLRFITPPENWYCVMQNSALNTITCANDT